MGTGTFAFDYPKLGHNSKYMILGANQFDLGAVGTPFAGAVIDWALLPANGDPPCPGMVPFGRTDPNAVLTNGDHVSPTFTPVPVNTMTGAPDGYVVSAYDPLASGPTPVAQNRLAVWHLDSSGILHQDNDITVATYNVPSNAPQRPDPTTPTFQLDTMDARLTQSVGDPATGIWTQHTVGGPGGRSVVTWYEVKVAGSVPSLAQEGNIASATDWVFNAAISPRFDAGGAAVFYNRSSPTIHPLVAAQERRTSTAPGAMEPGELVLANSAAADIDGSCNFQNSGSCRWGDYSAATPDPLQTNIVWGTNEFITVTPSGPTFPSWADENFAVPGSGGATSIQASAGDRGARGTGPDPTVCQRTRRTSYQHPDTWGVTAARAVTSATAAAETNRKEGAHGAPNPFTVTANTAIGSGPESVHSNPVTPTRAAAQGSPLPSPTARPSVNQLPAPPPSPPPR